MWEKVRQNFERKTVFSPKKNNNLKNRLNLHGLSDFSVFFYNFSVAFYDFFSLQWQEHVPLSGQPTHFAPLFLARIIYAAAAPTTTRITNPTIILSIIPTTPNSSLIYNLLFACLLCCILRCHFSVCSYHQYDYKRCHNSHCNQSGKEAVSNRTGHNQ